jgi:hypothetical protein
MRFVSLTLILIAAALCFVAGYQVGKQSPPSAPAIAETTTETVSIPTLTDRPNPEQVVAAPLPVDEPEPVETTFALRAQEPVQTFFDQNERTLVAEILEVKADRLTIRRQADGKQFDLPVTSLCAEDQAFAAYLWEQQPQATAPTSSQSMEAMIWDELFQ